MLVSLSDKQLRVRIQAEKFFCISVALFPILDSYAIPGIPLNLSLVVYGMAVLFLLVGNYRWSICSNPFLPLIAYIAITPLLMWCFPERSIYSYSPESVLLRYGKLLVCLLVFYVFGAWRSVDRPFLYRVMRAVVYVASALILIQQVAYLFGVVIPNPLSLFSVSEAYYVDNYTMGAGNLFRPSAFFLEPSHMTFYFVLFLSYALFGEHRDGVVHFRSALIASAGILLSGSGMGFVLVFIIWFLVGFMKARNHALYLGALVGVVVVLVFLMQTAYFQQVADRFLSNDVMGGNAIQARLGNGLEVFTDKTFLACFFGSGYGNTTTDTYYNGLTFLLCSLGIVGLFVTCITLIRIFRRGKLFERVVVLMYACVLCFAQIFATPYLLLYGAFLICTPAWMEDDKNL